MVMCTFWSIRYLTERRHSTDTRPDLSLVDLCSRVSLQPLIQNKTAEYFHSCFTLLREYESVNVT